MFVVPPYRYRVLWAPIVGLVPEGHWHRGRCHYASSQVGWYFWVWRVSGVRFQTGFPAALAAIVHSACTYLRLGEY